MVFFFFSELDLGIHFAYRPLALAAIAGVKQWKRARGIRAAHESQPMVGLLLTSVRALFGLVMSYERVLWILSVL